MSNAYGNLNVTCRVGLYVGVTSKRVILSYCDRRPGISLSSIGYDEVMFGNGCRNQLTCYPAVRVNNRRVRLRGCTCYRRWGTPFVNRARAYEREIVLQCFRPDLIWRDTFLQSVEFIICQNDVPPGYFGFVSVPTPDPVRYPIPYTPRGRCSGPRHGCAVSRYSATYRELSAGLIDSRSIRGRCRVNGKAGGCPYPRCWPRPAVSCIRRSIQPERVSPGCIRIVVEEQE